MNTLNHGWGMGFGWVLLFLVLGLAFYLMRNTKKEQSSAQDLLDKRYANGGIDTKEYDEKSQHLKG